MEIKHEDIIESIMNKPVRDRKKWEHLFIIKHKHEDNVRNYLLSMGEFKEDKEELKAFVRTVVMCQDATFHGIDCLDNGEQFGFEGYYNGNLDHPDPRPGHAIWIDKLDAQKLFRLFTNRGNDDGQ